MNQIHPGEVFHDENGEVAQLHGVGITRIGDRWYAWGEDKHDGSRFRAVACYSSADLATWHHEGDALTAASDQDGTGELGPDRIVERPKVLARPDGRFVMLLHIDAMDYSDAKVGWAIAESPAGPYRYLGSRRPMGNQSRDIGVYQEGGDAYLLSEDRANGLHVYRLTEDCLDVAELVSSTRKPGAEHGYESPTVVKVDGLYYQFGSDLTGWSTNDNRYSTAESLAGPWSEWRLFAPEGSHTFDSQVSVVLPVETANGLAHVYLGDRWLPDDLVNSRAVWLPMRVGDGQAQLEWRDSWSLADLDAVVVR